MELWIYRRWDLHANLFLYDFVRLILIYALDNTS
jgi:hypothetical protein